MNRPRRMEQCKKCPRAAVTAGGRTRKVSFMSEQSVEPGYCQCGCGTWVGFFSRTHRSYGAVKGAPKRFAHGHRVGRPWLDRAIEKLDLSGGEGECWRWTASLNAYGYAQLHVAGTMKRVHILLYEELVGPVPPGSELDHLCRNRGCVNPAHMEPVSHATNCRRGARTRLTWRDVHDIRRRRRSGEVRKTIAGDYGITVGTVSNIVSQQRWKDGT